MQIRISGGRIIHSGHFDGIPDIIFNDGKIAALLESEQTGRLDKASNIQQPGARKFDTYGKIVIPGLIDMHGHFQFISRNIPF